MTIERVEHDPAVDHGVYRRVLLMVGELHRRGYQRLRIAPGMSGSGLHWRCAISPVHNVSRRHGARLVSGEDDAMVARYTSGAEAECFGWRDATQAGPGELAALLIERFPALARAGRGSDWLYAGWYQEMLHLTDPRFFPIAYADWGVREDCLETATLGESKVTVPLPPPGEGDDRDEGF